MLFESKSTLRSGLANDIRLLLRHHATKRSACLSASCLWIFMWNFLDHSKIRRVFQFRSHLNTFSLELSPVLLKPYVGFGGKNHEAFPLQPNNVGQTCVQTPAFQLPLNWLIDLLIRNIAAKTNRLLNKSSHLYHSISDIEWYASDCKAFCTGQQM